MTEPKHACGGTWRPLPGQCARYRCDVCGAIGLKERVISDGAVGKPGIRPYKCTHAVKDADGKRVPCGRPMTGNDSKGRHACREHR